MTASTSALSTTGTSERPALLDVGRATRSRSGVRRRRPLLHILFNLGVDAETPLDLAIALRASNGVIVAMVIISVLAAITSLADTQSLPLALLCVAFALVYSACLLLGAAGLATAARWVFLGAASTHYLFFNLAAGHAAGAPFWIVPFVAYPACAFARSERGQTALCYVLLAVLFTGTEIAAQRYGPLLLDLRHADVAYYFQLVATSVLLGGGLYYYKNATVEAQARLDAAKQRIAELVANMLPPSIAARLVQGQRPIADSHSEASVLFADLTGFSALTHRLAPTHLVEVLNRIFSRFDEAAGRHRIEKIKTIGDGYMAATGVLDDPASAAEPDAMAEFAIEMLSAVADVARELGLALDVRIGISTGAVVSGVIGTRRFNFDVWGDTVNVANQMEQTGIPGRIQVSETTYWRLRDRYRFESRGEIELKTHQRVPTYLLLTRTPVLCSTESAALTAD